MQALNMKNKTIRKITDNAIVAAAYIVFTILLKPISYGQIQFRIAEILLFLVFFRKDFAIGLTIGCAIANLPSDLGLVDVAFGTLATLLSCLVIMFLPKLIYCILPPIIFNAFIVGAELYYVLGLPFWVNVGYVAFGEFVVLFVGFFIFFALSKNKRFLEVIGSEKYIETEVDL